MNARPDPRALLQATAERLEAEAATIRQQLAEMDGGARGSVERMGPEAADGVVPPPNERDLIPTHAAAQRFNRAADSVRKAVLRNPDLYLGVKRGSRVLVYAGRYRAYLNGEFDQ